jgi:hypothetical protein
MNARAQITPCIFGTTSGFEIHTLTRLPLGLEDLAFAIKRDEVELSDRHFCVKAFRLRVNSEVFTWIGLYRKAFEIGFSREGGYYGAGVWLAEITVDARLAMDVLKDLADQVNALAIEGGRFLRPLSDIINSVQVPQSLVPLKESTARYQAGGMLPYATQGAYICQHESLWQIAEFAQGNILAGRFNSIIAAPATSFPKNPSARLERYSDLTEVVHELASDLSKRISDLDSANITLEKHAVALEQELLASQSETKELARAADRRVAELAKEAEKWERRYRKLAGPELAVDDDNLPLWLRYMLYFLAAMLILALLFGGVKLVLHYSGLAEDEAAESEVLKGCLAKLDLANQAIRDASNVAVESSAISQSCEQVEAVSSDPEDPSSGEISSDMQSSTASQDASQLQSNDIATETFRDWLLR